jgi:cupin fold WbuC family metalloprotein
MNEVFHNRDDAAVVDENWLRFLKQRAQQSPLRRSRLCLHRSGDDSVHEMIIAMCKDVLFRPHRHQAKTESIHMIDGFLDVILFEDDGTPQRAFRMGPVGSGMNFCYRQCVCQFHAILPQSDFVVMHETITGPYVAGEADFAPWAPVETDALRAFLRDSLARASTRARTQTTQYPFDGNLELVARR